ncbi:hypothetical protein WMY93_013668 [Mugilogobius chulae]|uniref:Uncharacterized protein n=1 Tax=Mugilogobius chulae TaxID=88201 RepID=A0AAW0P9S7_9GOBI
MHWQHGQVVQGAPRIQNYQSTPSGASETGLPPLSQHGNRGASRLSDVRGGYVSLRRTAGHPHRLQNTKGTGLRGPVHSRWKYFLRLELDHCEFTGYQICFSTHRLIKVETVEKSSPAPGGTITVTQAVAVGCVKSPTSPPSEHDNKEKPIILEDYADPFDAEQAGGIQPTMEKVTTENDGYMEPYEAQKMMAEIRSGGRAPKDGSVRQLPLYDTPYEPAENGGDSDPERLLCPRESRLPRMMNGRLRSTTSPGSGRRREFPKLLQQHSRQERGPVAAGGDKEPLLPNLHVL